MTNFTQGVREWLERMALRVRGLRTPSAPVRLSDPGYESYPAAVQEQRPVLELPIVLDLPPINYDVSMAAVQYAAVFLPQFVQRKGVVYANLIELVLTSVARQDYPSTYSHPYLTPMQVLNDRVSWDMVKVSPMEGTLVTGTYWLLQAYLFGHEQHLNYALADLEKYITLAAEAKKRGK